MANKFVRGLYFYTASTSSRISYYLKLMYEFWGFCVYGGNSVGTPGYGAFAGSTTITAPSNGLSLPQATINVASTSAAPTSGTIFVHTSTGSHAVTYTGKTASTFTGCSGGTGTMSTGNVVNSFAATSVPGNTLGCNTLIASGSNGLSLPQATINVVSTTTFPTSGTIFVYTSQGTQTVTYTGVTSTSFTGCSGGIGTMSTGNRVTSNSLMTLGSDGYTNATTVYRQDGYTDFYATSAPFTSNMVGKQLVIWKAGSNSSEDSIYSIIAYKGPGNLVINVNNGGTPSGAVDGYRSSVTTRSSINYRVIDVKVAGETTGVADGNYYIFQTDPTGINSGQAIAQLQITQSGANNSITYNMSPNGSWTGTAFGGDASGARTINVISSTSLHQHSSSFGSNSITLIGDKDYMIGWGKDSFSAWNGFHWHWEIPERLYTQAQDPNPFAVQFNSYGASLPQFTSTLTGAGYGGGFVMRGSNGTYYNYKTTVKSQLGDGNNGLLAVVATRLPNIPGNYLTEFRGGANQFTGTLANSSGFLTLPAVPGQYSLCRAKLRRVRFANTFMKTFTRFSADGDWMLLTQGVAVPWDKTVMPLTIFPF